jgi:hypothetical protein
MDAFPQIPDDYYFPRVASSEFVICAMPKSGSRSVLKWGADNKLIVISPDDPAWYFPMKNREIYMIWRPPYERLLSGLYMGLAISAGHNVSEEDKDKVIKKKANFIEHFRKFAKSPDFSYNEYIYNHTRIRACPSFEEINWVHLNQLTLLPDYINKKYNHKYKKIDKLNPKEEVADWGRTTFEEFKGMLDNYPNVTLAIADRAAQDFTPESIINFTNL